MSLRFFVGALAFAAPLLSSGVRVQFDPRTADVGPFPTDFLTVPDPQQITGQRVNLPLPDCAALPSDCVETGELNQLDGFHVNPRLTVRFSAPINPETLRGGVWYAWADQLQPGRYPVQVSGHLTWINQVTYAATTFTAHAKPDEMLEGARQYLILVTDDVRDASGDRVETHPGFEACLARRIGGDYCAALSNAVARIQPTLGGRHIIGASLFTTLSTTAWFERARALVNATAHEFRRAAVNPIVSLSNLGSVTYRQHVAQSGANRFQDFDLPVPGSAFEDAGINRIAFASVRSPRFVSSRGIIPVRPTAQPMSQPGASEEVQFHVWLPTRAAPAGGYPVLFAGHGLGDSRFGLPTVLALTGGGDFAIVAITAFGHGYGPESSVLLRRLDGSATQIAAPGRAIDLDGNDSFGASEGCIVFDTENPVGTRDCFRQTVVDYLQVLHAIREGVDLDSDGQADLNPNNISYLGQSLGGAYGTILAAVAPDVRSAVLNVPPGFISETARLSPEFRSELSVGLAARRPALLAVHDATPPPLRYKPVLIRTAESETVDDLFERLEWLEAVAAPAVMAPHLKQATLPASSSKRILFQIAWGDRTVPNPSSSTLIRAANLREQTSLFRNDVARAVFPAMPANPHAFLIPLGSTGSVLTGSAALGQAFDFLADTRERVPEVSPLLRLVFGRAVFEVPAFLPEDLNF